MKRSVTPIIITVLIAGALCSSVMTQQVPTKPGPRDVMGKGSLTVQIHPITLSTDPGAIDTIPVTINSAGAEISAIDLLIAYDATEFEIYDAVRGDFLNDCNWEYFAAKADLICDGPCPSGLIKIVALSKMQVTDTTKICFLPEPGASIVKLLVRRNPTPYPQFTDQPIQFFWMDCGDNSISSVSGELLLLGESISDFRGNEISLPEAETADFPNLTGPTGECTRGSAINAPVRRIKFVNGLVSSPRVESTIPTDTAADPITSDSN